MEKSPMDYLYHKPFAEKVVEVLGLSIPHIIRHGGDVMCNIEAICWIFLTLRDLGDGKHEVVISGPQPTYILADFAIELLGDGHHSIFTTLSSLKI